MEDDRKKIKNGRQPHKNKNERRPKKKRKTRKEPYKQKWKTSKKKIPLKLRGKLFLGLAQLFKIF
jgi:hypothetical protein